MNDSVQILVIVLLCICIGISVACLLAIPLWVFAKVFRSILPRAFDYLSGRVESRHPICQRLVQSLLVLVVGVPSLALLWLAFLFWNVYVNRAPVIPMWDDFYAKLPVLLFLSGVPAAVSALGNLWGLRE